MYLKKYSMFRVAAGYYQNYGTDYYMLISIKTIANTVVVKPINDARNAIEIPMHCIDPNTIICPEEKAYWEIPSATRERTQFYQDDLNAIGEALGYVLPKRHDAAETWANPFLKPTTQDTTPVAVMPEETQVSKTAMLCDAIDNIITALQDIKSIITVE